MLGCGSKLGHIFAVRYKTGKSGDFYIGCTLKDKIYIEQILDRMVRSHNRCVTKINPTLAKILNSNNYAIEILHTVSCDNISDLSLLKKSFKQVYSVGKNMVL